MSKGSWLYTMLSNNKLRHPVEAESNQISQLFQQTKENKTEHRLIYTDFNLFIYRWVIDIYLLMQLR